MLKKLFKIGLCFSLVGSFFASFVPNVSLEAAEIDGDNLALNATVTYSGVEGDKTGDNWVYPQFVGEGAVDGNSATRWSANKVDNAWLIADLGYEYDLNHVHIDFHAETTEYDIQVSKDGENWDTISSVTDGSRGTTVNKTFDASGYRARYIKYQQRKQWLHATNGKYYSSSIIELKVYEKVTTTTNLSLNREVTYSGVEGDKSGGNWVYPQFVGEGAVDGNIATRWSANKVDTAWLTVDLTREYKVGEIVIDFHAETTEYDILISTDGENWETVSSVTDGTRGTTVTRIVNANGKTARYVKYQQQKQWLHATNGKYYSSSIIELKIYPYDDLATTDNTLRVGTFNIAAGKKPDVNSLRALTDAYNLEIVGLQEVDVNTDRNSYDMLSAFATNNYTSSYFSKAIDYSGGAYGIGTASQYELKNSSETFVDTTGASESRVFQRSVITKNGKDIAFYNLHFSWETLQIREKQFAQLKDALAADPIEYKIVVGDFNADQYHSEFYTFLDDMDMVNGYDGNWYETYNGSDSTMKHNSVDNILVSRNLKINNIKMVDTTLSDHNLFWAEVEFLDESAISHQWLKAIISEYENIDTSAYTSTSVETFENALLKAQEGVNSLITQTEVNSLTTSLITAYNSLEAYNLAYKKEITYSGVEGDKTGESWTYPQFVGENAVDGSMDTRWSANKVDDAWMIVDLGEVKEISEILIYFESAAPKYEILVSENGSTWNKVYEETDGEHGIDGLVQASFDMASARYVKYQQIEQWKHSSNGKYYSTSYYEIEVYKEFLIEEISLSSSSDVISTGDTLTLKPEIMPVLAAHKSLIYESDNEGVATIDENGKITGISAGTATITIKSAVNDNIATTFNIAVVDGPVKVSKLIIDENELLLTPRDKRFIDYSVYPSKAVDADLDVIWSSDDESIAAVNSNGLVECVSTGTATITVASKENPSINTTLTITVTSPSYSIDYDTMQDRWLRRVVGDETLDLSDTDVSAYIQNLSDEGQELWDSMYKNSDRTTLWDMTDSTVAADYTTQFTKINKLALAFGTKGSDLYQNKELYNDIVSAIDFMVVNKKYNGTYSTGNWWDWQIGCTHQLVDTLIILKDYSEYSAIESAVKSVEGYAKDPAIQWPSYTATGANRTDIGLAVLGSAIVDRDDDRMNLVLTKVPDVMKAVTSGDGLYADGSVVQHTAHAYSGSYGNELMKGVGKIQSITSGTQWEIKDPRIQNVYNTAVNGYIPLMERGRMMAMVNGRSISRAPGTNPFTTELASGSETISNLMLISQFAPEEYGTQIDSAVKYWLETSADENDFFANARDIESLLNAKAILSDENINSQRYTGMKVYGSMDRIVQANTTYSVGLAMYSSRIYNYEYGNTENPKGWHTADGALYLYTNDYKQYGEGYWTAIDPLRLAGTTTDTRARSNGSDQSEKSAQSLVGGVSDGSNGTGSMLLNKGHVTTMDLKAKKSWFFLDDKVIAVGSDIDGTTTDSIETTIENRVISDNSKISVNGEEWLNSSETLNLNEGSYIHYDEPATNTKIGYYFPKAQDINALVEERSGKYTDINNYFVNNKTYTMDFFSLGINHGSTVVDGSYEYVLFPDSNEDSIASYAKDNDLEIINTEDAHAIIEGNVFAMNTFTNNVEVNGFKVSEPACIYTKTVDGIMTISISNPKQNAISLELELTDGYKSVVSKDDKVVENGDNKFTINTTGAAGSTFTITIELNVDKSELQELIDDSEILIETDYTPATWAELAAALSGATTVNDNPEATYIEVEEAVNSLKSALDNLEKRPDKNELEQVIAKAEVLVENDYTPTSWEEFQLALSNAHTTNNNINATKGDVEESISSLKTAITGLVSKPDKSALQALYDSLKILDEESYTSETWKEFSLALIDANSVLNNPDATKNDVDNTYMKLDTAYKALEKITLDLSQLEALLNKAESLSEKDFTSDSWAEFKTVYDEAIAFYSLTNLQNARVIITQENVDDISAKLLEAINQLEKIDTPPSKKPDSSEDSENIEPGTQNGTDTGDTTNMRYLFVLLTLSSLIVYLSIKKYNRNRTI